MRRHWSLISRMDLKHFANLTKHAIAFLVQIWLWKQKGTRSRCKSEEVHRLERANVVLFSKCMQISLLNSQRKNNLKKVNLSTVWYKFRLKQQLAKMFKWRKKKDKWKRYDFVRDVIGNCGQYDLFLISLQFQSKKKRREEKGNIFVCLIQVLSN